MEQQVKLDDLKDCLVSFINEYTTNTPSANIDNIKLRLNHSAIECWAKAVIDYGERVLIIAQGLSLVNKQEVIEINDVKTAAEAIERGSIGERWY